VFKIRSLVGGSVMAVIAIACNPLAESSGLEPMTIEPVIDGASLEVDRDGNELEVTDTFEVQPGDIIRTSESAAHVQLAGSRTVWMAPNSEIVVGDDDLVRDPSGSILVQTKEAIGVAFEDDIEIVSNSGVFRLDGDRQSAAVVAYEGSLTFTELGEGHESVGPLFEVNITPGHLGSPRPYRFEDPDNWDDQYLGREQLLEEELDQFHTDLSTFIDGGAVGLSVFKNVIRDVEPSRLAPYLGDDDRSVSDVLIAAGIAKNAPNHSINDAVRRSFKLHDLGASWGVVAAIMEVDGMDVVSELDLMGDELLGAISDASSNPDPSSRARDVSPSRVGACANLVDCILDE
jgi:hypothetical protein